MKKSKVLVPALGLLLVSTAASVTGTVAWFSANRTVEATGMSIKTKAPSSLIIAKANDSFVRGQTSVGFSGNVYTVLPATQYASSMKDNTESHADLAQPATKLAYVANPGDVDPETGLAKATKTLYYAAATTQTSDDNATVGYYRDFVMYLGAEGDEDITEGTIKVSIPALTVSENALYATSVQILYNDEIKVEGLHVGVEAAVKQEVIELSSTEKIPHLASGSSTISGAGKLTIRVYIDGALTESAGADAGKAYVRNKTIVDLSQSVSIDATIDIE